MQNNIKDTIIDAFTVVGDNLKKHQHALQRLHDTNLWLKENETHACIDNKELITDVLNTFIHLGFMVQNQEKEITTFTESCLTD